MGDLGGGTGFFSIPLIVKNIAKKLVIIDSSPEMIQEAKKKKDLIEKRDTRVLDIDFLLSNIFYLQSLIRQDKKFDVILCGNVLSLVPKQLWRTLFKVAFSLLKEGGKFFLFFASIDIAWRPAGVVKKIVDIEHDFSEKFEKYSLDTIEDDDGEVLHEVPLYIFIKPMLFQLCAT